MIEQTSVALAAVFGGNSRALSANERSLLQLRHILAYRGHAHAHALADLPVAEQTLIGLAVLPAKQETVHRDRAAGQPQIVDLVGQWEIVFDRIPLGPALLSHFAPPDCSSAH